MRTYCGPQESATLQNLARYVSSLSKMQEGSGKRSTRRKTHRGTRRLKKLITFRIRQKATPAISMEQRHVSASSSSSSANASNRSERRNYHSSSRSRKQSNRLDTALVITQVRQTAEYSSRATTRNNTGGYCRFCFNSHTCRMYATSFNQTFRWPYFRKRDIKNTRIFEKNGTTLRIEAGYSIEA